MITIKVKISTDLKIELPVNSFDDIMFENMKKEISDELILDAIWEKYKIIPEYFFVK